MEHAPHCRRQLSQRIFVRRRINAVCCTIRYISLARTRVEVYSVRALSQGASSRETAGVRDDAGDAVGGRRPPLVPRSRVQSASLSVQGGASRSRQTAGAARRRPIVRRARR